MQLHEKVNLIFGTFMVAIYLAGGILIILFANKVFNQPNLAILLGWVMVGYSVIRFMRVYESYKRWRRETQKR